MLIPRILTAVLLLALLIPALAADVAWPFLSLTLVLIAAASWEWARLNGSGLIASYGWGLSLVIACAAAWAAGWTVHAPVGLWWLVTGFGSSVALAPCAQGRGTGPPCRG